MNKNQSVTMEFHVSRLARDRYQFNEALFSLNGNVIFANFHAARQFAQKMNQKRDLVRFPEQVIQASQINALGLIDEILHLLISQYRQQRNPNVIAEALDWLDGMLGKDQVDDSLRLFANEFPALLVYRREQSIDDYLQSSTDQTPNRQILLEEMLMLWITNANPACVPYRELFDDSRLVKESAYSRLIPLLHAFFETQPGFGPDNQNLIDLLRAPALAVPYSLSGQLEYIRKAWGAILGKFLYRLLSSLDFLKEEEKAAFFGPGPAWVLEFAGLELEPERFSQDRDWMPNLVLIAKNAYVWLDQLSKRYQAPLTHLDQIPDAELDELARSGITGLWLIGLWERSPASQRIKQLRGNPEAVASAYSLLEYQIAGDLGGEESYHNLRERAWARGIRLSSDMVPNHMGIDSRWVIEHPDWFISLDYSPFPSYSFNGPNLSWDERVGLFIEDHYYNNTDAAVVFKRVDNWTGSTKYIYHGNDGTSMPWNDTAQLNYLKPEVREAVIQTILHVARKFPVIRFDAAMTLAKKHYQRLWYPEPGSGGDIPTRAEQGLTREQFDAAIPVEFWREVVDRVAQEVPDTLLLAEAFWLMEGYFVRTLGMHRVYNSAFMNMLRDEKNAEYRLVMKNTLEFDPEILKRYVNFMNNPDERTAVDQFGKGDKYFGICTLLATLPGLPMLGHGQVEGFTEKYGMEYRRAYWDEQPDSYLVDRHKREIFPLLRKRYLFAEVHTFLLYDFYTPEGYVCEDVFAYSNRAGDERSLVVYHNKYASTRGWVRTSAAYSVKTGNGERVLVQKQLGEGLALSNENDMYCVFRDQISGLEFIRSNRQIFDQGLYLELEAYKAHVFTDFRQAQDNEWHQYAHLSDYLNGRGVPSIDEALREIFLQPVHTPFRELVNAGFFRWVITHAGAESVVPVLEEAEDKATRLLSEIQLLTQGEGEATIIAASIKQKLGAALHLPLLNQVQLQKSEQVEKLAEALDYLGFQKSSPSKQSAAHLPVEREEVWGALLGWLFTHSLGEIVSQTEASEISRSWIDEWLLGKITAGALGDLGVDERTAWHGVEIIKLLIRHGGSRFVELAELAGADGADGTFSLLMSWLADSEIQRYLGINRYQDVLWYNREAFDDLVWWLYLSAVVELIAAFADELPSMPVEIVEQILAGFDVVKLLQAAEAASGYQVEKLQSFLKSSY